MKQHLQERMAALHIDIDEATAQRHLADVAAELKNPGNPNLRRQPRRIKVTTLVAATLLVLLPGAALAADGAVPGDALYPVKLAVERVLLLVDPNIEAEHRIEEVEKLVDRAVPYDEVSDGLVEADLSVRDRDVPRDLLDRLDMVRDRVATDYSQHRDVPPADDGGEPTDTEPLPPSDVPRDEPRPTTTISPTTSVPPETDRPQPPESTTTAPRDDERPPSDATTTTEPRGDRDDPPRDG